MGIIAAPKQKSGNPLGTGPLLISRTLSYQKSFSEFIEKLETCTILSYSYLGITTPPEV